MIAVRIRSFGRCLLASLALLAAATTGAHAQRTDPVLPGGARIRIRAQAAGVHWTTTAIIGGFGYSAGAGAAIGASLPVQRWRPVSLPRR